MHHIAHFPGHAYTFTKGTLAYSAGMPGMSKILDIASAALDLIKDFKSLKTDLLEKSLRSFSDVTYLLSPIHRINEIVNKDEDGLYLWQYGWCYIATTVTYAASSFFSFMEQLDNLTLIKLGQKKPVYSYLGSVFLITSCAAEMVDEVNTKGIRKLKTWVVIAIDLSTIALTILAMAYTIEAGTSLSIAYNLINVVSCGLYIYKDFLPNQDP